MDANKKQRRERKMGMDVIGRNPKSKKGEYFGNNVWWWRPLWDFCYKSSPDIISKSLWDGGHYNDGKGLNGEKALQLADKLTELLNSGASKEYSLQYARSLKSLPDQNCDICEGTGKRKKPPQTGRGKTECNGCHGTGKTRPFETNYPFSISNVRQFRDFLLDCGGFEIW